MLIAGEVLSTTDLIGGALIIAAAVIEARKASVAEGPVPGA